ncbi:MAG: S24/S26 family peptidase [bacterium]|nr:S24/S26 family peptidase [bacterium]
MVNAGKKKILILSRGWSMYPLIKPNDELLVDTTVKVYSLGDVIVYQNGKLLTAHRIVRTKIQNGKASFLVKGDNISSFDGWVNSRVLLGKVKKIINPQYTINLSSRRNQILKYFFIVCSVLNYYFPFFLRINYLKKLLIYAS